MISIRKNIQIATPTVAGQMGYPYTAVAYALACVTSVGAVYCMFRCRTILGIIGSTLCVAAGSVDMIDGYAVIKFSDEPPRE